MQVGTSHPYSVRLTPDPRTGDAAFADCSGTLWEICEGNLGGGEYPLLDELVCGNQCGIPTRATAWSTLKALFGH